MSNPFCSCPSVPVVDVSEKEFVHYMEVEEVADGFDKKRPSEFLIEKKMEVYERVPIDEYINSFASKVGLKNELKGIISKSQMDEYIQVHKAQPGFVDLTKLPDSQLEMKQFSEKVDAAWSSIPEELRAGLTKEEFLKQLSAEKIKNYVLSQMPSDSTEKKDGDK